MQCSRSTLRLLYGLFISFRSWIPNDIIIIIIIILIYFLLLYYSIILYYIIIVMTWAVRLGWKLLNDISTRKSNEIAKESKSIDVKIVILFRYTVINK
jgi:hypothetical protein